MWEYQNIKRIVKEYTADWPKKPTVPLAYDISDLNNEEIVETFYEKRLKKTKQIEIRIKKAMKKKGNRLFVK